MTPLFLFSALMPRINISAVSMSGAACQEARLLHLSLRCGRFVLRLQGIQRGYLVLDCVDAVAPRLMLGVQLRRVIRKSCTCCLCLGILDGFVVVAAKLRFQRVAFAVESVFLLDDF